MPTARHNLGIAVSLKAEALGQPGQRTFRLVVEAERGTATIWMEKQQLSALALSIKGALEEAKGTPAARAAGPSRAAAREPAFEFKAGAVGLTYDERTGRLGILASTAEDAEANRITLVCWAPHDLAAAMAEAALEAVTAGRPVCPLCGGPIDPLGHMCPRANGHGAIGTVGV